MLTGAFWRATVERVLSTAAQAFLALLIVSGFDLRTANWPGIGSVVGLAALISLTKCIAAGAITKTGPSVTNSEQVVPPVSPEAAADQDPQPQRAYRPRRAMPDELHGGDTNKDSW